jgi:hypothetical protein
LEAEIWKNYQIPCEFLTLSDLAASADINRSNRLIYTDPSSHEEYEISVAYYRSGYTPVDYPTENEWKGRIRVEQSSAIKCPSIGYHLAGCKAIQSALTKPKVLEDLLDRDASSAEKVSIFFIFLGP